MKGADGQAALRCWPVDVEVVGRSYRIVGRPAIDWILKLIHEDWLGIVPGLVDGDEIDDLISDGMITTSDLIVAGRDATVAATGMPWWAACRILAIAGQSVELMGAMVIAGVDPERVSIGAYVAALYRVMVAERDQKQRASLDMDLLRVPPGVRTAELYDAKSAGMAFERAFAQQQQHG